VYLKTGSLRSFSRVGRRSKVFTIPPEQVNFEGMISGNLRRWAGAAMLSLVRLYELSRLQIGALKTEEHRWEFLTTRKREMLRSTSAALLVAIGYYIGTLIGFELTPQNQPISTFWPPNAILLASLLLTHRRRWWMLLLAVLPAHMLIQLPMGVPWVTSIGWYLTNTGEALLGAYLITEVQDARASFERVRGLVVFLVFAVFCAPLVTSFVDAAVVTLTGWGRDYWLVWTTRLLSNMLAEMTLVPAIVLFWLEGPGWIRKATLGRSIEAVILFCSVVMVGGFGFAIETKGQVHVSFFFYCLLLPILLWASLRFEFGGLSATLLTISLIMAWAAIHGRGPFFSSTLAKVMELQLFLCIIALPFMFLGAVLAEQRETARSLRESRGRLIDSQEQERRRIARELHDGVGQALALAEIELAQLSDEIDVPVKPRLQTLVDQLAEISNVTREISHGLHPSHLEYLGLPGALSKLCRDAAQDRQLEVEFVQGEVPPQLDSEVSLSLYRVAQEALHNVTKYSRARRVEVCLRVKSGRLWMDVVDDGVGFAKQLGPKAGIGMESMRERMELIGGAISIKSAPMKGTKIQASVPLDRAA